MKQPPPGEHYVPACVRISGEAAVCPMIMAGMIGAPIVQDCGPGKRGIPHLHCTLGHVHMLDGEGNILDAPAAG